MTGVLCTVYGAQVYLWTYTDLPSHIWPQRTIYTAFHDMYGFYTSFVGLNNEYR